MDEIIYCCPYCKGKLGKGREYWECKSCGKSFEVRRGVPILDTCGTSTQGLIGLSNPGKFLDEVEQNGWRSALENLLGSDSKGIQRTVSSNRITWQYLLEIDSSWKVLDIGAGSGGVACQLAKVCSVTALDKSWCDAVFMHLRAKQDNLAQFEAVVADAVSLPFESDQFDLATMIGVLEWIPTGWPERQPREVQLQALQEAYRVLKPGGRFFLGIENRYYFGYFLGVPEPHTHLKYISLMDRDQARLFSLRVRGKPYLELTYSKDEMIEFLKEAGFEEIQTFWLYPDYLCINYIIPLDRPNIVKAFVNQHIDPGDMGGALSPLYYFYRFLNPDIVSNHVGCYGFLARRLNKQSSEQ
jgi:ubiquinone/menaquinone biosynthesis C-methylase UbiE